MKKNIRLFLLLLFLFLAFYSLFNILKYTKDVKNTKDNIKIIKNNIEKNDDVINIDKLKLINGDTIGYITIKNTNIDYPYVKTDNNSFYLNHGYDKKYNAAGWVFMDYRNDADYKNQNTILYAHGRLDKTMFGELKKMINKNWFDENDNTIYTTNGIKNYEWKIFSVYKIPTTDDYLKLSFSESELKIIKERSVYSFDESINENDYILTLSTCYDKTNKLVIHAKMIKE